MSTVLWIISGLLAFAFLGAGSMKLMKTPAELVEKGMGWAGDFTPGQVKIIGLLEVLGAIGLIAPVATGVLTMLGAIAVHIKRSELPMAGPGVVLGALSAYVAYSHLM
jgi:hypothetical protein